MNNCVQHGTRKSCREEHENSKQEIDWSLMALRAIRLYHSLVYVLENGSTLGVLYIYSVVDDQ